MFVEFVDWALEKNLDLEDDVDGEEAPPAEAAEAEAAATEEAPAAESEEAPAAAE